ncbi:MAG: Clp1/GlmU family protein [Nitrospirota bacterium]
MKRQLVAYKGLEIIPEPEWEGLVEELICHKGVAFLIGATDSGKSTLVRYLIEKLITKNIVPSLVDSDIGQSSLGLPGTISTKIFKTTRDIEDFSAEEVFFVGSLNPARKISMMIEGTRKMVGNVRADSEIVLIDTTGLIQGEAGKALKIGKVKTIRPEHIIAIQRHNELEHILTSLADINIHGALSKKCSIHRVNASRMAKGRNREARIRYRRERFNEYFEEKKVNEFLLYNVGLFYNGKPFRPKGMDFMEHHFNSAPFKEGTLIGLNHNEDTMALGILLELDSNSITFKSPIKSVRGINRVVLGDINIYN